MALTTRTNGSASGNIIQASWFNDFKDLLTGVMTGQPVALASTLTVSGATSLAALTTSGLLTASAGLTVTTGAVAVSAGALSVSGLATLSGGITLPNTQLLLLSASTGTNAYLYCNSSNDLILHAGNSNRVSIVSTLNVAQFIVDGAANQITAVPKLLVSGGLTFPVGFINKFNYLGGNGSGTFNHGLSASPVDIVIHLNTSTMGTYSVYGYTTTQCSVNVSIGGLGWAATAWC